MNRSMDIELMRQLLACNPETGLLTWLPRKGGARGWNARHSGKAAFTAYDGNGYRHGTIFDRKFKAHRVIWALHYGEWPESIDHINGIRDDNRVANLRSVTQKENTRNQKIRSNNTSGVMGVCWDKQACKWRAQITAGGRNISIGVFTDFDDAVAARNAADIKHGFHANHGRVA